MMPTEYRPSAERKATVGSRVPASASTTIAAATGSHSLACNWLATEKASFLSNVEVVVEKRWTLTSCEEATQMSCWPRRLARRKGGTITTPFGAALETRRPKVAAQIATGQGNGEPPTRSSRA